MTDRLVHVKNVKKTYYDKDHPVRALDDVTLDIYKGEVLSLLGVNGAGKTTLSSILATLHPPTSGDVFYKDSSIYNNLLAYRYAMGFCPQRPNLDPYLNVEENLIYAGRYFLLDNTLIKERVKKLIEQFGLERYAKFNVNALSGGYKQRVLIARALMHDPEIVLFDEPTVGLDPDIRRHLWGIIRELKNRGKTIILTTHYLEEAEILSDRVCILNKGKVILTETVHGLKDQHKKEKLEDIFLELVQKDHEKA